MYKDTYRNPPMHILIYFHTETYTHAHIQLRTDRGYIYLRIYGYMIKVIKEESDLAEGYIEDKGDLDKHPEFEDLDE